MNSMAARIARPPFVGRERALGALREALELAAAGRGNLLLVNGEPGIGKTRLAEELASQAGTAGFQAVWARCWEGAGAPAFWPWIQVVRAYASAKEPAALRSELGATGGEVARLVPEIAELSHDRPAPPDVGPEEARFRLFDNLAAFLRRAARSAPLLVVLDDLHWADEASLQLLGFLAGDLHDSRIAVLGT